MTMDRLFFMIISSFLVYLFQGILVVEACPRQAVNLNATYTPQYLLSPRYPSSYPRPAKCNWKIRAVEGDIIVLRFFAFDLEPSIFCYRDYLSVIDGHTSFHPEILFMCGSFSSAKKFRTTQSTTQVEFLSLATGSQRTGFRIGFWTEDTIKAPYKDVDLSLVNYILIGISAVLTTAFLVFLIVISKSRLDRKRMDEASDGDIFIQHRE